MNTSLQRIARTLGIGAALFVAATGHANMGAKDTDTQDDPDMDAGRSAIEARDWAGAVSAMQRAVAAKPLNADAHNWLGFAYRKNVEQPMRSPNIPINRCHSIPFRSHRAIP